MQLIYGCNQAVAKWVGERIPFVGGARFGECVGVGIVDKDGNELAGVVFHDWQPAFKTIAFSMAAASPKWCAKGVIRELFAYPFEQLAVLKVWTATPHRNARALKALKGLGFVNEAVLSHHFGKEHAVINRMLRSEYDKKYGVKNGEAVSANAA